MDFLVSPVTLDEIQVALKSIKGDKSPGPDGYNSSFYHQNWETVGPDLVAAISQFFQSGFLLKEWNSTAISLVPKVEAPSTIKDYRPISCCNVPYKCITKILVNRMQPFLPSLINPCQSAFVKGRSIVDNVLLMQELVKDYHKDQGPARCAMKLDLMKAYDSVFFFLIIPMIQLPGLFFLTS